MNLPTIACCLTLAILSAGCAPDRIRPQALQISDADLKEVKNSLLVVAVHISPRAANMKLRGVDVRNSQTSQPYGLVFFDNAILGTRALQHSVVGDSVRHLVMMDLPPGSYELTELAFAPVTDATASKVMLRHKLPRPVRFEVRGERVTYLGRLDIKVISVTLSGPLQPPTTYTFPLDKTVRIELYQTVVGDLSIAIGSEPAEDVALAKGRYRALANEEIAVGRMSDAP
jgi:hypothetical protein